MFISTHNRYNLLIATFTLLSVVFSSCSNRQNEPLNDIISDSTFVSDQLHHADKIAESQPDSALSIYMNVVQLTNKWLNGFSELDDPPLWLLRNKALSHRGIGVINTNSGNFQKAFDELEMAQQLIERYQTSSPFDYKTDIVTLLNSMGVIQKKLGQYPDALATYQKAVSIAEENNDDESVAIFYTNTGNIYQEIGDSDKAYEYIKKAIDLHNQNNNDRGVAISSLTLANILNSQGKFNEARPYYIKALTFCEEQGYNSHVGLIKSNLGVLEKRLGNLSQAKIYFDSAIENLTKVGNRQGLALVYGNLADLAISQSKYPEAIIYATKQLEEAKQSDALVNQRFALKHLSKSYAALGNYQKAYENHLLYSQIHDSIVSLDSRNEIARLEAVYQDQKKMEEIDYLANLSEALKKKNRFKNFLIVSISLLLVLSILLAFTWIRNSKLKSEREQLNLEQKLLRSQMNPHFLFNSLSAIQNMVIRADKMVAAGLLASFSQFIRFILDGSRTNLIPLNREIEAINLYLDLQKVRFPNLFTFKIEVSIEDDPSEVLIPPLIIQPFVENSVIHGFPKNQNDGELIVQIYQSEGNLCCRVKDNGVGMEESKVKREGSHKSVATKITLERLNLLRKRYKCNASFEYEKLQEGEKGTSVLITLPFIFSNEEEKWR